MYNLSNVIMVEEDKSMWLTEFGDEWITVRNRKNKKNKQIKKLLEETLQEALTAEKNVPGLNNVIDPIKWQESYDIVLNEYYKHVSSYTSEKIREKIEKQKTSDNKHVRESNYVQLDCRLYDDGKELDVMYVNGYKFMINRFFGNDEFINKLKKYYRSLGYNIGFVTREIDGIVKYTHIKVYFKR